MLYKQKKVYDGIRGVVAVDHLESTVLAAAANSENASTFARGWLCPLGGSILRAGHPLRFDPNGPSWTIGDLRIALDQEIAAPDEFEIGSCWPAGASRVSRFPVERQLDSMTGDQREVTHASDLSLAVPPQHLP